MKKIKLVSNIIINELEQILLIKKETSNKTYPISGKLEKNEEWMKGAKREIIEETKLKPQNTKYITKSKQIFLGDKEIETQWFFTSKLSGVLEQNYREGFLYWQDIATIDTTDLLSGDKQIIIDFLNQNLKSEYSFTYDIARNLIND